MLLYLLKASILLLVLYLFYKSVLEKESFFASNRLYLMGSLVLCFVLPFVSLPIISEHQGIVTSIWEKLEQTESQASNTAPILADLPPAQLPVEDQFGSGSNEAAPLAQPQAAPTIKRSSEHVAPTMAKSSYGWQDWLLGIYAFGVLIFFLHLLSQLASLWWRILRTTDKIEDEDHTIVNVAGEQAPCSFFHYILINPAQFEYETYEEILTHERIHVRQGHTLDLLFAELVTIVLWFNPLAWFFRKEVEKNIEYQTDALCLQERTASTQEYQMNLLRIASQHHPLTITTNYNQSLLKQRILKMNAKKSNPHSMWKFAFTVPLVLAVLLFLNTPNSFGAQGIAEAELDGNSASTSELAQPEADPPVRLELQLDSDSFPNNPTVIINECEELEAALQANDLERVRALLLEVENDCLIQQNRVSREVLESLAPLLEIGANLEIDPEGKLVEIRASLTQLEQLEELDKLLSLSHLADAYPAYSHNHEHPVKQDKDCEALVAAIEAEDIDLVAELLKTTDPNCWFSEKIEEDSYTWHTRKSPLVAAAKTGNIAIAQLLLDEGLIADFNTHGEPTPLMAAAGEGHLEMVKFLQAKGADPDVNLDGYGTPLARASAAGAMPVMEYLVAQNAKINASGAGIGTPLLQAARHGQNEAVEYLLKQEADPNVQVAGVGTALSAATRKSHYKTMEILLNSGSDIDLAAAGVGTPLMEAVQIYDEKAMGMLRAYNADVNVRTPGVGTALSHAARANNARMIQLLLDDGANPELSGAGVGTPLMLAARNKADDAMNALLAGGASLNTRVDGVGTVLSEAVQYGNMPIIKRALADGANPNLAGAGVGTPLILAVRNNDQATVEYLLQNGADIDAQAPGVGTPLSTAVRVKNMAMVKYLLAQEAEADAEAAGVGTPLIIAIRNGNYEIVKLLLENGADPNQSSYIMGFRSAKEAAHSAGHAKIVELLEAQGAQ